MDIINKKIEHFLYGDGTVICRKEDILYIQFSEPYGVKQFIYPDAFEKYLKLCDLDLEKFVMEEINNKKLRIETEKLRRKQEYEADIKSKALERSKLTSQKKKTSKNSNVLKQKSVHDSKENLGVDK